MEAILALEDGRAFWGRAYGAPRERFGEVVFNTSISGYQEILTDPSYAGQIVVLTYPHIGNYGTNPQDSVSVRPFAEGLEAANGRVADVSQGRRRGPVAPATGSGPLPRLG